MDNFFKNLGNKKSSGKKPNFKNPFGPKFKGSGSTLGGSKPGTLVKITFSEPGSLGLKVEKTASKGTIVSSVFVSLFFYCLGPIYFYPLEKGSF